MFLEGVEVVFIVLTFGLHADIAAARRRGAALAAVLVGGRGVARRPLSKVPENTMKFAVGVLLEHSAPSGWWRASGSSGLAARASSGRAGSGRCSCFLGVWIVLARGGPCGGARGGPGGRACGRERWAALIRFLAGFGRFWYDFVVGDDWRIAAGVVCVLAGRRGRSWRKLGLSDTVVSLLAGAGILAVVTISIVAGAVGARRREG